MPCLSFFDSIVLTEPGPSILVVAALVHVPIFGELQGRRTGVGVTTVSNSLILGGWVTKVLKNDDQKQGGGRVGDNSILTFLCYWLDKKIPL